MTQKGTFRIVGFDEDGEKRGPEEDLRLVCNLDDGGKLAVWGDAGSRSNIDKVMQAELPCLVECEWCDPKDWAKRYGHTHWVAQGNDLTIVR